MRIGTRRAEEARVFDSQAGYHQFHQTDGVAWGSFEVFWHDDNIGDPMRPPIAEEPSNSGWYWAAGFPGCLPDGDAIGPFGSSAQARLDTDPNWGD